MESADGKPLSKSPAAGRPKHRRRPRRAAPPSRAARRRPASARVARSSSWASSPSWPLAGVGVYTLLTAGRENTDDAQVAADMVPVGAARRRAWSRASRINENQPVKRGDLLVELDPRGLRARACSRPRPSWRPRRRRRPAADAQVEIVEATSKGGLASARAVLTGSTAGVRQRRRRSSPPRAPPLARADAELHKAEIDLAARPELRKANAVPQERLDSAQIALDAAARRQGAGRGAGARSPRSRAAALRAASVEARGRVSQSAPVAPQIAAARAGADLANARVRSAEAALALAKLQLGYTKWSRRPTAYASKLTVHEGQLVDGRASRSSSWCRPRTYVVANFKETQIGQHAPRPARRDRRRRLPGPQVRGAGREPGRRHRRQLLAAAAGQRHGQLRQGRPARPGADRAG